MHGRRAPTWAAAIALVAALTACDPAPAPRAEPADTPTPSEVAPPSARSIECSGPVKLPDPPDDRPLYRMSMQVAPERRLVTGRTRVTFSPDLDTDRLEFRLWPNGPLQREEGARLTTGEVRVGGRALRSRRADPTRLVAPLGEILRAGDEIVATLDWRLRVPGAVFDRIAAQGESMRLGSFFPILAWEPGVGWSQTPATSAIGETFVSPTADFEVDIEAPRGVEVFASGGQHRDGVWRATAVRDFAVAVGRFRTLTERARAPRPVEVTVAVERGVDVSARDFLDQTARALRDFGRRFGPYPWDTFTMVVNSDLSQGGIEYPTIVFQGPESLSTATSHEVAHQWFYSLVGNDQGRDPWLDEGLASYAQARADDIMELFDRLQIPSDVRGALGQPMTFWEQHQDDYYEGAYAQGVKALSALGPLDEVDCALRHYATSNAYLVARPDDLVRSLRKLFPNAHQTLAGFRVDL